MLSIIDALDDPNLFGPWGYGEPSWATWRAVLKGAFGLRMTKREREFFRRVAERDPPKGRVKELWTIVGRRGGKELHRQRHRNIHRGLWRLQRPAARRAGVHPVFGGRQRTGGYRPGS